MTEFFIALFLLAGGFVLTGRMHFFNPNTLIKEMLLPFKRSRKKNGVSPFAALCTALGGCVGTGNIIGVATCIASGGAGSVFWIWVCAFFSLGTKYTEIFLSSQAADSDGRGSPLHYMSQHLGKAGTILGVFWCILCVVTSLISGGAVQANACAEAAVAIMPRGTSLTLVRLVCGILLFVSTLFITAGGLKRVSDVSKVIVPLLCAAYVAVCVICIFMSGNGLSAVLKRIFTEAFSPRAAASGSVFFGIMRTMRLGVSRGIFSNEAGMGTSPLALSSGRESARERAAMGIWEVIIDTFVICSATALLILCCVPNFSPKMSPVTAISGAFSVLFGKSGAKLFLSVCIFFFAYTSILGWEFYGNTCVGMVTEMKAIGRLFSIVFCIMLIWGCLFPLDVLWNIGSTANMVLALPNTVALLMVTGHRLRHSKNAKRQQHRRYLRLPNG